jgi:hypothetical protein
MFQRLGFKPGGIQQKRVFPGQGLKTAGQRGPGNANQPTAKQGTSLAGPGKGQIDARDMITIRNRIKIPDARAKIVQKRITKGTFDARSKLKPGVQQQARHVNVQPSGQGMVTPSQQPVQNVQFQRSSQASGTQGFQMQGPPQGIQQPVFSQQGPQFQQRPPQQFSQPFNQPQFNQQPRMRQPPPNNFNQQPPQFSQRPSNFNMPNPNFQQVPDQNNSGDLVNFTVNVVLLLLLLNLLEMLP